MIRTWFEHARIAPLQPKCSLVTTWVPDQRVRKVGFFEPKITFRRMMRMGFEPMRFRTAALMQPRNHLSTSPMNVGYNMKGRQKILKIRPSGLLKSGSKWTCPMSKKKIETTETWFEHAHPEVFDFKSNSVTTLILCHVGHIVERDLLPYETRHQTCGGWEVKKKIYYGP